MTHRVDGVIESVRYAPDGKIALVRYFERRGSTYSDYELLKREDLVRRLKAGKRFAIGIRQPYLGFVFDITRPVILAGDVITSDRAVPANDHLEAPLF
ncbi:MAG: hypothetical protein ABFD44_09765 [Anaerolineaceae bacterium]